MLYIIDAYVHFPLCGTIAYVLCLSYMARPLNHVCCAIVTRRLAAAS